MNKVINCVTGSGVLDLLPQKEAAHKGFISASNISVLAEKIKKEAEEKRLTKDELINILAESSLLSFILFELLKENVKWPKDITA